MKALQKFAMKNDERAATILQYAQIIYIDHSNHGRKISFINCVKEAKVAVKEAEKQ
jgi:hypothetical protein